MNDKLYEWQMKFFIILLIATPLSVGKAQIPFPGTVIRQVTPMQSDVQSFDSLGLYLHQSFNGSIKIHVDNKIIYEKQDIRISDGILKAGGLKNMNYPENTLVILTIVLNERVYINEVIDFRYSYLGLYYDRSNLNFHINYSFSLPLIE